jgi:hypothetical protein
VARTPFVLVSGFRLHLYSRTVRRLPIQQASERTGVCMRLCMYLLQVLFASAIEYCVPCVLFKCTRAKDSHSLSQPLCPPFYHLPQPEFFGSYETPAPTNDRRQNQTQLTLCFAVCVDFLAWPWLVALIERQTVAVDPLVCANNNGRPRHR